MMILVRICLLVGAWALWRKNSGTIRRVGCCWGIVFLSRGQESEKLSYIIAHLVHSCFLQDRLKEKQEKVSMYPKLPDNNKRIEAKGEMPNEKEVFFKASRQIHDKLKLRKVKRC